MLNDLENDRYGIVTISTIPSPYHTHHTAGRVAFKFVIESDAGMHVYICIHVSRLTDRRAVISLSSSLEQLYVCVPRDVVHIYHYIFTYV